MLKISGLGTTHQGHTMSLQGDRTTRHLFVAVLLMPLFALTPDAFNVSAVDAVLRDVQECRASTNPALAVAVVKDGRLLLSRGYGVTTVGGEERVTPSTRFSVASLSKAFTATLLLKVMEEDGRYNLSSKIRHIIGEDFVMGDEVRTKEATVEDMLSHKMALPSNNRLRFDDNLTRANLKDRLKYLQTPDLFRNVYIYSNLMYGLATHMTELIGNARWEDLVRRHLLEPLGMDRSTFVKYAVWDTSGLARPYSEYFGSLRNVSRQLPPRFSELAGSGSVVSTAYDMAKWMTFHLSKGQGPRGVKVMSKGTMEELYKPRTAMNKPTMTSFRQPDIPVTFTYDVYSMGFRRGYYRGYPIVGHGGSSFGYRSLLTLMPSQGLGVFVVMTGGDTSYRTRGTVHAYLMDQALNVPSWLNVSTMCSFPEPWHRVSSKAWPPYDTSKRLAFPVSAYVGHYHHPAYGTFEVREWQQSGNASSGEGREPAALLTLFYGYATWDLIPLPAKPSYLSTPHKQSFYGKGRDIIAWVDYSPFVFHAPPAGSDVILKMSAPGLEKRSPPVFTRVGAATSGCGVCFLQVGVFLLSVVVLLEN